MLELSDNMFCSYRTGDLDVGLEKMELFHMLGDIFRVLIMTVTSVGKNMPM